MEPLIVSAILANATNQALAVIDVHAQACFYATICNAWYSAIYVLWRTIQLHSWAEPHKRLESLERLTTSFELELLHMLILCQSNVEMNGQVPATNQASNQNISIQKTNKNGEKKPSARIKHEKTNKPLFFVFVNISACCLLVSQPCWSIIAGNNITQLGTKNVTV